MRFVLQVHYCCWEDLLTEVVPTESQDQAELFFWGASRQHAKSCNRPEPKRSRKRSLAEIAATSPEIET